MTQEAQEWPTCLRCGQPAKGGGSWHPHCAQTGGPGIDPDAAAANVVWWTQYLHRLREGEA